MEENERKSREAVKKVQEAIDSDLFMNITNKKEEYG